MKTKRTSQGYPKFPQSLGEFQRRFSNEKACFSYLMKVRWPDGFECPQCSHRRAWQISLRSYRCAGCRKEIHLTAGTVMHGSHLPAQYWFWAAYLLSTLTPGMSALQLKHQLGIGSYQTALYLCRRLRRAMVNPAREPLNGVVEVDEAYVGGPEEDVYGREVDGKVPVVVAVENRGDHTGRIRLEVVKDVTQESLHAFVRRNVAVGSQVNTDNWRGYWGLEAHGYKHRPKAQRTAKRAGKILPWVHRVIGNLKTWLRGTHHGVSPAYLPGYLDEFTFRYNRRRYREHAFLTLLILATKIKPVLKVQRKLVASSG
jgi:DNA-directed RNA polymerase subunit RPC12/RpoP/transposase-like protein